MSYARLNNSSDSEDEAPTSPSAHVRRTSSAAAASLASLIQSNGPRIHEYSQLSNDVVEEEESTTRNDAATVDHELENSDSENDIEIHVRFGESKDLKLRVPRTDTIAQVKEKVKLANEAVGDKYMRLIYAGKILSDNKTLMESLPKFLFTQVEVPHHHDFHDLQSKLSSSVEAVEAAASNILAGISSRTGGSNKTVDGSQSTVRAQTSLGSILPTHITYPSSNNNQSENSTVSTDANATTPRSPSSGDNGNHVSITITSEPSSSQSSKLSSRDNKRQNVRSTSTIKIPVQTGPIYFLCSLSDFPPAQPPSNVKKGKAVATNDSTRSIRSNRNRNTAATTTARAGSASSPLALPRRGHSSSNGEGPSSRTTEGVTGDDGDVEDENDDEAQSEEELSPTMTPQPTGFDRLREAGFSEDEIRVIRRNFHARRETQASSVGENGIAVELDQDEDTRARARRIEEEWIDQHGAETLPEGLEGSYGEMVWGLMLGFFMGLIVLFWFREATFSRKQQLGIIAGLMINVGFGVLHLCY